MNILVVGAGAVGGYFGGRLLEQKRDVTFLVRPGRAAQLASSGLIIRSRMGDVSLAAPRTVLAEDLHDTFDLVLLSCKAYDMENAMASFAPAVGSNTAILPLLNGMRHLELLDRQFGSARVLGGQCFIAATMNEQHEIVHLNEAHDLSFGERSGVTSDRVRRIAEEFTGARCNARLSTEIVLEMWEKWAFIASAAGGTCLMRASVGDILTAPGGKEFLMGLLDECGSVAEAEGHRLREASIKRAQTTLTTPGSPLTASMLRDIERNAAIEADHIVGDMLRRGAESNMPKERLAHLAVAFTHLKSYEARREKELPSDRTRLP
jgi:2-dehydropantoate 2-reductase